MGLRDRIKRAQKAADEHTTVLTCLDNGDKRRVPDDAGLRVLVADWCEETGHDYSDSLVEWLSPYLERGLANEEVREWPIGDLGGGMRGLTG
jgi:hypothetical protein